MEIGKEHRKKEKPNTINTNEKKIDVIKEITPKNSKSKIPKT
jgi:hypothetical protein